MASIIFMTEITLPLSIDAQMDIPFISQGLAVAGAGGKHE